MKFLPIVKHSQTVHKLAIQLNKLFNKHARKVTSLFRRKLHNFWRFLTIFYQFPHAIAPRTENLFWFKYSMNKRNDRWRWFKHENETERTATSWKENCEKFCRFETLAREKTFLESAGWAEYEKLLIMFLCFILCIILRSKNINSEQVVCFSAFCCETWCRIFWMRWHSFRVTQRKRRPQNRWRNVICWLLSLMTCVTFWLLRNISDSLFRAGKEREANAISSREDDWRVCLLWTFSRGFH